MKYHFVHKTSSKNPIILSFFTIEDNDDNNRVSVEMLIFFFYTRDLRALISSIIS